MNRFIGNRDATSIALHTCVFLSLQPQGIYYSSRTISDAFKFSIHHVAKVVQKLAKAGIIETVRGGNGGIRLKKKPSEICIYDIYSVTEGKYESKHCGMCLLHVEGCNGHDCLLGKWMKKINDDTIAMLKKTSLPTLVASIERLQPDRWHLPLSQ